MAFTVARKANPVECCANDKKQGAECHSRNIADRNKNNVTMVIHFSL